MSTLTLSAFSIAFGLASAVPAQSAQFRELPLVGHVSGAGGAVRLAQTGAGFADAVFLDRDGFEHYANDGQGRFSFVSRHDTEVFGHAVADVDGDGDEDLLVIETGPSSGSRLFVYRASQGGLVASPGVAVAGFALLTGDLDGDGDLDAVVHGSIRPVFVRNDGAGNFTVLPNRINVPLGVSRVELADLDGDGDLDLVHQLNFDHTRGYLNDGRGFFSSSSLVIGPQVPYRSGLFAADFDGDGDVDLALEQVSGLGLPNGGTWILYNDGTGNMQPRSPNPEFRDIGRIEARVVEDIDGDGRLEFVRSFAWGWRVHREVFGQWMDVTDSVFGSDAASLRVVSMDRSDVDGDGLADFVVATRARRAVLFRQPSGGFDLALRTSLEIATPFANALTAIDLDGDGREEILHATGQGLRFHSLDLAGRMVPIVPPVSIGGVLFDVAAADFDGNGAPDIAVCGLEPGVETLQIWMQRFSAFQPLALDPGMVAQGGLALEVGDLTGDGRPDLLVASRNGVTALTVFPAPLASQAITRVASQWVLTADMDRDGDLDVVANGARTGLEWFENRSYPGRLRFAARTRHAFSPGVLWTRAAAAADVDGDGDQDLVTQSEVIGGAEPGLFLWRNDGRGSFAGTYLGPPGNEPVAGLEIADVDLDGVPDIVVSASTRGSSRVLFGRGEGFVELRDRSPLSARGASHLLDTDLDGDLDLLLGFDDLDRLALLTNVARQVRQPDLAVPGGSLSVELHWRSGIRGQAIAWPLLGFHVVPTGLGLPGLRGRLFVDPFGARTLPATSVTGVATLSVPVPATPSLSGLDYWVQAAWIDGSDLAWSNLCANRLR